MSTTKNSQKNFFHPYNSKHNKQTTLYLTLAFLIGCITFSTAQIGNYTAGQFSGASMTSDDYNVAVGDSTLYHQIGEHFVVALGFKAGFNNDQDENIFIGYQAGFTNTTGADNLFIGFRAGYFNTATDGTFIGNAAGFNNTDGADNTYIGERSGSRATSGDDNTYIGASAGPSHFVYAHTEATTDPATGSDNTAVGSSSGYDLTTGYRNTFIGNEAGYDTTTGYWNTFVGDSSGVDNGIGYKNTFIGQGAGAATEYADENTFIGVKAGWDNNRTNKTNTSDRNTAVGAYAGYENRDGEDNVVMGAFADFANNGSDGTTGQEYNARNIIIGASALLDGGSLRTGANDAVIMGYNIDGNASEIVGIGAEANVMATGSIGIGYLANITKSNAIGIGHSTSITGTQGVAIGTNTIVQNNGAIVLGYGANSMDLTGTDPDTGSVLPNVINTVAIGHNAASSGFYSVAIGSDANATLDNTMLLGGLTNPLSVGIGTDTPNSNASLTLEDTNKGLLINRLTTVQKTTLEANLTATENGMLVYDTDLNGIYVWDGIQWLSAIADDLGNHTATATLDMDSNPIDNTTYLDFKNTEGFGVRFWNGSDSYKISMGNSSNYQYGPVTGFSIKNTMNGSSGRGWTWGINGQTPIAAIDNTGKMQIASTMTIGAYTLPNTDGTNSQILTTDGAGIASWTNIPVNTDSQELALSTNTLSISGNAATVDLASYLDNTDTQNLTSATLSGTTLTVAIENGTAVNVDLAPILSTLQSQNTTQQAQIDDLISRVTALEGCTCNTLTVNEDFDGEESKSSGPILYQNIPNPFNNTTSIKYYVPRNRNSAAIVFSNTAGQIIDNVALKNLGEQELFFNSESLASGLYYYTLFVEGRKIDSKKMIIE